MVLPDDKPAITSQDVQSESKPLRLAIVSHNVVKGDGQGRVNYEIARYALKHGVKVTLLADHIDEALVTEGAEWVRIQPAAPWRKINLLKVGLFARAADAVLKRRAKDFDVIHGHGYCLSRPHHVNTAHFVHSAWLASSAHTAKQHKNLYGAYQWTYSAVNVLWEKKVYDAAQVIVAVSSTVRDQLKALNCPPAKLRVIFNGTDLTEFHPGNADRTALTLPESVMLGLFVGDLRTPRKNLDTVLKAIVQTPNVHLAVVGNAENSPFPEMAQQLGIADRVHFLGYRRDIAQIMRACDVLLFPSRYEPFGLVLLEALASGLPVITAQTTGGSELVEPEWGGCIPDPNDVAALTNAIVSITSASKEKRQEMGRAARRRAECNGWDDMCRLYLKLYYEVAAKSAPSTCPSMSEAETGLSSPAAVVASGKA